MLVGDVAQISVAEERKGVVLAERVEGNRAFSIQALIYHDWIRLWNSWFGQALDYVSARPMSFVTALAENAQSSFLAETHHIA